MLPPQADPLAALEAMTAAHAERAKLETRLTILGGKLQTPAEFEQWYHVVQQLGLNFDACRGCVRPSLYAHLLGGGWPQ